jgi:Rrf2 family cysteine metabolism transcriptional repressor
LRLSRKSDYALRALIYVAGFPEETSFQIRDLAEKNGLPKKFLELILLDLKNAGILKSRRGVGGGYLLARRPDTVRATEIIEAVEGPLFAPEHSGDDGAPDGVSVSPAVTRLVEETSRAAAAVLNGWTLAELVREEREALERRQRNLMYFI